MAYVYQRWLARELCAAGLKVIEVEGWKNRGRPASTGHFDPRGPATTHHTGTPTSKTRTMPTLKTLIEGRPGLPGPLSQVGVGYDGTVYVIAAGRANHAGRIGKHGVPGMPFGADGNALAIGQEVDTDGTQPLPKAQRDAIAKVNAVLLAHYNRGPEYAHRHADISGTGKWDIGQLTTAQLRADITAQEDDVALDNKDVQEIVNAIMQRNLTGKKGELTVATALRRAANAPNLIRGLPDAIEKALPGPTTGGGLTRAQVRTATEAAIRNVLGSLDEED